jgi:DNA-binding cell septation regulator SpoVG
MTDNRLTSEDQAPSNVTSLRPEPGIVCISLTQVNNGATIAYCELEVVKWGMVLRGCRWMRGKNGEFIGLPSTQYKNRDGKIVYKALVEFADRDVSERFQQAALAAVRTAVPLQSIRTEAHAAASRHSAKRGGQPRKQWQPTREGFGVNLNAKPISGSWRMKKRPR